MNNDFDYFIGENFGVSKLLLRCDWFDSIDLENLLFGSCDFFMDYFGDGFFYLFNVFFFL